MHRERKRKEKTYFLLFICLNKHDHVLIVIEPSATKPPLAPKSAVIRCVITNNPLLQHAQLRF